MTPRLRLNQLTLRQVLGLIYFLGIVLLVAVILLLVGGKEKK